MEPQTWSSLYFILEALQKHANGSLSKMCRHSKAKIERFKRTANSATVLGVAARHADTILQPPTNPMTLQEACIFMREAIENVANYSDEP